MFSIVDDDTLLHVGTVNHRAWHADHDGQTTVEKMVRVGLSRWQLVTTVRKFFLMPTVYIHLLLHVTSWNA